MPEGRAADCFRIAAIKGNNITFEIVKESDGSVIFDTSMGKTAIDTLVLIGEPGDTVYRINLTGAARPTPASPSNLSTIPCPIKR